MCVQLHSSAQYRCRLQQKQKEAYYVLLLYCCCIYCVHICHTSLARRRSPAAYLVGLWITFLLARRHSPVAALLLVVHSSTQQYIVAGTLVAVPPQGVTRE